MSQKRKRSDRDFNAGYVLAVANLINLHGSTVEAEDVMRELDISWSEIRRMDLSEYDMDALKKIKRDDKRCPFREEPRHV